MFRSYKNTLGLVIKEKHITIVTLKNVNGKIAIDKAIKVDLDPGIVRNGIVSDEDKLSEVIKKILRENKINKKNVVFSVPVNIVIGKLVEFHEKTQGYVQEMAEKEANKYMLSGEQPIINYYFVDEKAIFIFVAKAHRIRSYVAAIKKAKLNICDSVFEPIACLRSINVVEEENMRQKTIALIFGGEEDTGISIFKNGKIMCCRNVEEGDVSDIVKEVRFTFSYWATKFPDSPIEKILLLGDTNKMKEIHLQLPETSGDIQQGKPLGKTFEENNFSFSVGAGAAMKIAQSAEASPVNLLPYETVKRIKYEKIFLKWFSYISILFFLSFLASFIYPKIQDIYEQQNQPGNKILSEQPELLREVEQISAERTEMFEKLSRLESISKEMKRLPWNRVLKEISRFIPQKVWVTNIRGEKDKLLVISGKAFSQKDVYTYVRLLSVSDYFYDTKLSILESKIEKRLNEENVNEEKLIFNFQIACFIDPTTLISDEE